MNTHQQNICTYKKQKYLYQYK